MSANGASFEAPFYPCGGDRCCLDPQRDYIFGWASPPGVRFLYAHCEGHQHLFCGRLLEAAEAAGVPVFMDSNEAPWEIVEKYERVTGERAPGVRPLTDSDELILAAECIALEGDLALPVLEARHERLARVFADQLAELDTLGIWKALFGTS